MVGTGGVHINYFFFFGARVWVNYYSWQVNGRWLLETLNRAMTFKVRDARVKTQTRHGRARPCFNYLRNTFNRRICLTPEARFYSHLASASGKIFQGHVDN